MAPLSELINTSAKTTLEALLVSKALNFGDFTTKAGRRSPYFVNFGALQQGRYLQSVADGYLDLIRAKFVDQNILLFGPAYKGIPLVSAIALRAWQRDQQDLSIIFNRKEQKDHGEGGELIGNISKDRTILIVDDVLSRGSSIAHSLELLAPFKSQIKGVVVGIDRCESGFSQQLAKQEILSKHGIELHSILSIHQIIELLCDQTILGKNWLNFEQKTAILNYIAQTYRLAEPGVPTP
jgi:orotate phosphoribosyltransferase